ncbi:MAG: sulfatase-like hydrolase/transferase [Armatimonadota bacterium]|nr:MAG: sulfatase-like hydrolase/transferase [Armatimonadota bacterium]
MKRRAFLRNMGLAAAAVTLPGEVFSAPQEARKTRKPNVIVILADDQGYADTGFTGCTDIPTPNIDSIARHGVHFTQGVVSHPYCSPTRAGLMTGRYQQRFGHECNPTYLPTDHSVGIPTSELLVSDVLAGVGYVTGAVGKWHLGAAPPFHPNRRGFTEFYGFLGGGHDYMRSEATGKEYLDPLLRNDKPLPHPGYLTDALSDEAAAFVRRHSDEPFLLYLAYNAPHAPMQATEEYLQRFEHIEDDKRRRYAAMVSCVDDGVGRVLQAVRECGLENDTLIFFLSDNGGQTLWGADNTPLRGRKGAVYEGGFRVPFAAQWIGTLPQGARYEHPVSSLDIFVTAAAAAGAALPSDRVYDGRDVLPYVLGGKAGEPHERLFWRAGNGWNYAVRESRYKLVGGKRLEKTELYDLSSDPCETTDIAAEKPDEVDRLSRAYEEWNREMVPPRWPDPKA